MSMVGLSTQHRIYPPFLFAFISSLFSIMNEDSILSLFQRKCSKTDYRIFFILFLILQFLLGVMWKNWWLSDIVFVLQVLLWFLLYWISVKRYRDIWEKYPFFIALMLFVPIVWFLAMYDLLTKKSHINKNSMWTYYFSNKE